MQKDNLPDEPFDPDNDRPVEADELNFQDDDEPSFSNLSPEEDSIIAEDFSRNDEDLNINEGDDIEPEDLIKEDGARSAHEPSAKYPADTELHIVDADDIGAGYGLDEAELAQVKPLDNKP